MSIDKEKDYGTPASSATEMVNLEIDGFKVTVPAGTVTLKPSISKLTISVAALAGVPKSFSLFMLIFYCPF